MKREEQDPCVIIDLKADDAKNVSVNVFWKVIREVGFQGERASSDNLQ